MSRILYLHGFLSSPQSLKAQITNHYIQKNYPDIDLVIPAIPNTISQSLFFLDELIHQHFLSQDLPLRCIGSSMGGFLSHVFVERYTGKAVLVNPAVSPHALMQDYLGEHQNPYSGERFTVDESHIESLKEAEPRLVRNSDAYFVMLQKGDEVLDYRLAEKRFAGSKMLIEEGGDHTFTTYEKHLDTIFSFLLS